MTGQEIRPGLIHFPGLLSRDRQEALVETIRDVAGRAPLYTPTMPRTGKAMTVRMTNCGDYGWVTDREAGYRYQTTHPVTGNRWPAIPDELTRIWEAHADYPARPQACLINFYGPKARMGMHQDRDEEDLEAPVVSLSLGDSCLFRFGGRARKDPSESIRLESGDMIILAGPSRMIYHGVDRIYPDTSDLLKQGGRINLTLRRVTR